MIERLFIPLIEMGKPEPGVIWGRQEDGGTLYSRERTFFLLCGLAFFESRPHYHNF